MWQHSYFWVLTQLELGMCQLMRSTPAKPVKTAEKFPPIKTKNSLLISRLFFCFFMPLPHSRLFSCVCRTDGTCPWQVCDSRAIRLHTGNTAIWQLRRQLHPRMSAWSIFSWKDTPRWLVGFQRCPVSSSPLKHSIHPLWKATFPSRYFPNSWIWTVTPLYICPKWEHQIQTISKIVKISSSSTLNWDHSGSLPHQISNWTFSILSPSIGSIIEDSFTLKTISVGGG